VSFVFRLISQDEDAAPSVAFQDSIGPGYVSLWEEVGVYDALYNSDGTRGARRVARIAYGLDRVSERSRAGAPAAGVAAAGRSDPLPGKRATAAVHDPRFGRNPDALRLQTPPWRVCRLIYRRPMPSNDHPHRRNAGPVPHRTTAGRRRHAGLRGLRFLSGADLSRLNLQDCRLSQLRAARDLVLCRQPGAHALAALPRRPCRFRVLRPGRRPLRILRPEQHQLAPRQAGIVQLSQLQAHRRQLRGRQLSRPVVRGLPADRRRPAPHVVRKLKLGPRFRRCRFVRLRLPRRRVRRRQPARRAHQGHALRGRRPARGRPRRLKLVNAKLFAGATISPRQAAELVRALGLNVA
jgi:hypothetical protein